MDENADNKCDICESGMPVIPDTDTEPDDDPIIDDPDIGDTDSPDDNDVDTGIAVVIVIVSVIVGGAIFALIWLVIKKKKTN